MFTQEEKYILSNRLLIASTELFLRNMEEADNVMNGTYRNEISFADHPDTKLAIRLRARDVRAKMHEKRVEQGLAPKDIPYKPTGNETMIAHPSQLAPIIPASVREELSRGLKKSYDDQATQTSSEESERSVISPVPPILPLVRSLSALDISTESKEQ